MDSQKDGGLKPTLQFLPWSLSLLRHRNGLGSVVVLSDDTGTIVERYEYAPFGAVFIISAQQG